MLLAHGVSGVYHYALPDAAGWVGVDHNTSSATITHGEI